MRDRLKELGHELPSVPNPAGSYVPATSAGLLVFTAGQLPFKEGQLRYIGKVDKDVSVEEAKEAARLCALAALEAEAGSIDNARIVKVTGYVASAAGFNRQPEVINGASDFLSEVFGERGPTPEASSAPPSSPSTPP